MAGSSQVIIDAIRQIAGVKNDNKVFLYEGSISEVIIDEEDRVIDDLTVVLKAQTCIVDIITGNDINKLYNVELSAGIADGLIVIPVINSKVYVLSSIYCNPFIIQYSDVSKYNMIGSEFGGLIKIIELTEKLNNLENKVNDILDNLTTLKSDYNSHLHTSGGSGSPTTTPTVPTTIVVPSDLTLSERDDYENKSINHGKGEF